MAQTKYYYDAKTCNYEQIRISKWDVLFDLLGFLTVSLIIAVGIFFGYTTYFESPKEAALKQENEMLRLHYNLIQNEVEKGNQVLAQLQHQDDSLYRIIFEVEPIATSVRRAGVGGTDRYQDLINKNTLIATTLQKVDQLKRQMYIQSKSYDEILKLAQSREKRLASLPAIQPLSNRDLKRLSSAFGMRPHPIHKIDKMHWGVDFVAPRGTPVYATGEGIVKVAKTSLGYGKWVEIEHSYGYSTRYAHLQDFNIKQGKRVKRGQCIGYVGMSGGATGPHLHYEVLKNRKPVNPVHYFFHELDAEQYDKVLELASRKIQSLS